MSATQPATDTTTSTTTNNTAHNNNAPTTQANNTATPTTTTTNDTVMSTENTTPTIDATKSTVTADETARLEQEQKEKDESDALRAAAEAKLKQQQQLQRTRALERLQQTEQIENEFVEQTRKQLNVLYTVLHDYECMIPNNLMTQLLQQYGINLQLNQTMANDKNTQFVLKLISASAQLYIHKLLQQCKQYGRIRQKERASAKPKPYLLLYDDIYNVLNDNNIYLHRANYIAENLRPNEPEPAKPVNNNNSTTENKPTEEQKTTTATKRKRPSQPSRSRRKQKTDPE